jgi:hypothetical protein
MAASSLTSGVVVTGPGWTVLDQLALPPVLAIALATLALRLTTGRARSAG